MWAKCRNWSWDVLPVEKLIVREEGEPPALKGKTAVFEAELCG